MTDTIGVVFPGQGSQGVGMGQALAETYPSARSTFAEADDCLGYGLSKLCFEGPEATLNDTYYTQPAIFVTSIAAWRALQAAGWPAAPSFAAGHSLGEYGALVAAGALSFPDGLRLVQERGRLMKSAGERNPGGMAAVLQLDVQKIADICEQASQTTGRTVQVANYNSPGQVVISGDLAALEEATRLAQAAGARRVTRLAVSIAAHSPLMSVIADEFRGAVEETPIGAPKFAVVANVTAQPLPDGTAIRQEMVAQLTSSVRWVESVEYMVGCGATTFVEIGPKEVLTGLISRINKGVKAIACGTPAGVQAALEGAAA
jgi:[acyl-carrier-protein] S-malonyltransferase